MSYADLLASNQTVVEAVIDFTARRHRLSATERDDFASEVRFELVDNDYAILRRFEQRCSLRTYLTIVIERLFLDHRVALWSKWRPSAMAKRLGPLAVRLDMLTGRDGLSFQEAAEVLRTNHGVDESEAALYELYSKLPVRPRRRFVGDDALANHASASGLADAELHAEEQISRLSGAAAAVETLVAALPPEDRLVLRMRFFDGCPVATVARTLGLQPAPLYRRLDRLLKQLRTGLETQGFRAADIAECLGAAAETARIVSYGGNDGTGSVSVEKGDA